MILYKLSLAQLASHSHLSIGVDDVKFRAGPFGVTHRRVVMEGTEMLDDIALTVCTNICEILVTLDWLSYDERLNLTRY